MAVKSPQQATRIALSELKMRLHLPTLRSLELQVTHFCNMNCPFCYAKDIMTTKKKEQIPLENIQQIIKGCYALGMIHVNITGGEPLIRKDIVELVDCIPKDVVVSLVTNSVLLTRQKTDELINAGLSTIQMSFGSNYPGFNLDLAKYCVKKGWLLRFQL